MKTKPHINNEQLREIRNHADWRKLFAALRLTKDVKKSTDSDWWALSPFTNETEASFHINDKGFFCFSTKEQGGAVELVQAYFHHKTGEALNCYDAGRWLLENKVSYLDNTSGPPESVRSETKKAMPDETGEHLNRPRAESEEIKVENQPIRHNLIPALTQQGEHPEFVRRGISKATCEYLGCGYYDNKKGQLSERIVFQVRGVRAENGVLQPVILTHIGRAANQEQKETEGKWRHYKGFLKKFELYNIDKLLLDREAVKQAHDTGKVLIVEGCFDIAKLIESGIKNAVASFGSQLLDEQIPRLQLIKESLRNITFCVWYDRDKAGIEGQEKALELLKEKGFEGLGFNWAMSFSSKKQGTVKMPSQINDVCDFTVEQLRWLRKMGVI